MKALFIGGTGTISAAVSRRILAEGWELWLLNRGNRNEPLSGEVHEIRVDINNEEEAAEKIRGLNFDVVADFIGFALPQVERDFRLFNGRMGQYIFISSAAAYQKPLSDYRVSEATPLANPYWQYAQNKIACEQFLMEKYRETGFPVTIVRPSHTYDERSVPLGIHGKNGSWQVLQRMREGKPVIIHGDGTSLWTMTHNSDFARGFTGLMANIRAIGEAVQITSAETLTWNQIYAVIAGALGVELRAAHISSDFLHQCGPYDLLGTLTGDKANSVVFDNAKLKRLVPGFSAQVRFDQGVRDTIAHILSHPEYQRADPDFDVWCDRVIAAREEALQQLSRPAPGGQI